MRRSAREFSPAPARGRHERPLYSPAMLHALFSIAVSILIVSVLLAVSTTKVTLVVTGLAAALWWLGPTCQVCGSRQLARLHVRKDGGQDLRYRYNPIACGSCGTHQARLPTRVKLRSIGAMRDLAARRGEAAELTALRLANGSLEAGDDATARIYYQRAQRLLGESLRASDPARWEQVATAQECLHFLAQRGDIEPQLASAVRRLATPAHK